MTKILGLDASTKCTGYGVVNSVGKLLSHGSIDYSYETDIDIRIDKMIESLDALFNEIEPDIVYVEDSWKAGKVLNIQTTKKLTNIIGAVRCLSIQHGSLFNSVYPSEWRSAISIDGGKGTKREEFKQRAMEYVKKKYDISVPEDESEGICIAYAGNIMNNKMFEEDLF